MENNNKTTSSGITIIGLLGIVFIVLKLCKVISWSWWWVLAPFWIPVGIGLVAVIGVLIWAAATERKIKKWFK